MPVDRHQTGQRLLLSIRLDNLLSFAPGSPPLELDNLNLLIGPNASGKSNLIEAISLIRSTTVPAASTATDMLAVMRRGGGVQEWIWKGDRLRAASVDVVVGNPGGSHALRHVLTFRGDEPGFRLEDERIENETASPGKDQPYFYYRFQHGQPVVNTKDSPNGRKLARETVNPELSILSQRRDPEQYPEIAHLANSYEKIRIYREWSFGRNTLFREPQRADLRNDRLEEDFSNLGLFLSRLRKTPKAKTAIQDGLKDLYEGVTDFEISVEGGTVQVFFTEGDFSVPATRLSDGTIRYLCLLAILCDPQPPPLICIEEPELGLHPDILPKLADLLLDASERCQLIVTTHSDVLVDAFTRRPQFVVTFERHATATAFNRLDPIALQSWLEKYRLGELWTSGQIGGTRW